MHDARMTTGCPSHSSSCVRDRGEVSRSARTEDKFGSKSKALRDDDDSASPGFGAEWWRC